MLSVIPLLLTACSPKYKSQFKEEINEQLSSNLLRLEGLSIKEINKTPRGSVFSYKGNASTTQDLYVDERAISLEDSNIFLNLQQKHSDFQLNKEQKIRMKTDLTSRLSAIEKELKSKLERASINSTVLDGFNPTSGISSLMFKKLVTPSGAKIEFSGQAKAHREDDGKWYFEKLSQSFPSIQGNPLGNGLNIIDGSPQSKIIREAMHESIVQTSKAMEEIYNSFVAQNKHAAETEAAEKDRMLKDASTACAAGKRYYGHWQNRTSAGEIGIRFDRQIATGSGLSLEGVLFDPSNEDHTKPFTGVLEGDGSSNRPFLLTLQTTKDEGYYHDIIPWGSHTYLETVSAAKPFMDKTSGFLVDVISYPLKLVFDSNKITYSGHIQSFSGPDFFWTPIELFFSKNYALKSAPKSRPITTEKTNTSIADISDLPQPSKTLDSAIKRSPEIVHQENRVVLSEFAESFRAARAEKDLPKMKEIIQQVLVKYPDTATTHYWLMNIAFLEKDSEALKKQYQILISDYPETPELSAKREAQYEECMKELDAIK